MKRIALVLAVFVLPACRRATPPGAGDASPAATSVASASSATPIDAGSPVADPCAIVGSRQPLLVRWTPEQRAALASAMREGIAVVAANDCHGVRLLPDCHAGGRYGYAGIKRQTYAVELASEEELRINAPLAGVAVADAGVGSLHVDVAISGRRATTRRLLGPNELTGECQGATHFVGSVELGDVGVRSTKSTKAKTLEACANGALEDREPKPECSTLVTMTIHPIANLGTLTDFVRGFPGGPVNVGVCPPPMVVSRDRCTRNPGDAPFLCAFGDGPGCSTQCERGDINSCDVLGMMTWYGKGVAKDSARAAALYTKACDHDDSVACANLGVMNYRGDGVAEDKAKAATLFDRACKLGAHDACANLGGAYMTGAGVAADKPRALALLTRSCDAGSPESCGQLARGLRGGKLGEPDSKRGIALLDELCAVDDAAGCLEIARLTFLGDGVPSDHARGASLMSRACGAGSDEACVMLGLLYRQADGVPRDDVLATRLMQQACDRGNADGCHNLGIAYEHGKGIAKDTKRAAELYDSACKANVATACLFLADFAAEGIGVAKDAKRATELRAKACSLGEKRACPL